MTAKTYPPSKDRRDIGKVESPIDKIARARQLSSCCIGVEAMLEGERRSTRYPAHATAREDSTKKDGG